MRLELHPNRHQADATYLLATEDELVATFLREVLVGEEALGAVDVLARLFPLLVRTILVLLWNTVQKVVAGVAKLVHKTILLGLSLLSVVGHGVAADGILGVLPLRLGFLLCSNISH